MGQLRHRKGGILIARRVDYMSARQVLEQEFAAAAAAFRSQQPPDVPPAIAEATTCLLASQTQAYREALVGCAVIRIVDPETDVRYPHLKLAENAFSGRSLDEHVVNPFLREQEIPSSGGPYLSALRRAVSLELPVPQGQRDREAFTQMARFVDMLRNANQEMARLYLQHLLYGFLSLREKARVVLARIRRLSLDQYRDLLQRLLTTPSGGRLPVLLVVAVFQTIQGYFELDWDIEWQEINVSDAARHAGGDVTIKRNGDILMAIEVTERPIDASRVRATFRAKISQYAIDDYVFFFTARAPTDEARAAARQYFAQGHHIGFLSVVDWAIGILGTVGPAGRSLFNEAILALLDRDDMPREIKVAWNRYLEAVVTE